MRMFGLWLSSLIMAALVAGVFAGGARAEMVALYEMEGAVFKDSTSNTDDYLSVVSTPLPGNVPGAFASAWDFYGTSAYASVATNQITQALGDTSASDGISIGFWVNGQGIANWDSIISLADSAGFKFVVLLDSSIYFQINSSGWLSTDPAIDLFDGHWHHVLVCGDFSFGKIFSFNFGT